MVDKIKAFISTTKDYLLYIVGPVLALVGYIMYLNGKVRTLASTVSEQKAEKELVEVLIKKKEVEDAANQAEVDYISVRDKYKSEHPSSGESEK